MKCDSCGGPSGKVVLRDAADRLLEDAMGGPVLLDATFPKEGEALRHARSLGEVVGGEKDGAAPGEPQDDDPIDDGKDEDDPENPPKSP